MESDHLSPYRSRILREMNANRNNPFNSPPSSTGSHGAASPTASSIFSDPEGESTRKLNEDIARITADRKLPVNWEAAHRKWPEFFNKPQTKAASAIQDSIGSRLLRSESKENQSPRLYADDESTRNTFMDSKRTRAEMQPRVDNDTDLSPALARLTTQHLGKRSASQTDRSIRIPSGAAVESERRPSISEALDRLRKASSLSPKHTSAQAPDSMFVNSAKSSLTAVQSPPRHSSRLPHDASYARSLVMPEVSHLEDLVTGTLQFNGSNENGVPVFVKTGNGGDRQRKSSGGHAQVESMEIPDDEKKIFISMDMIRQEIISLQEHYDKVSEYAESLQLQVEKLEAEAKLRKATSGSYSEQALKEKIELETEITVLNSRLEQLSRQLNQTQLDYESISQERDRAQKKLQDACDDITSITRQLNSLEKEIEGYQRRLESMNKLQSDYDKLRREVTSLKHSRDALELKNGALQDENEQLKLEQHSPRDETLAREHDKIRQKHDTLTAEIKSLRSHNQSLMTENGELRDEVDQARDELNRQGGNPSPHNDSKLRVENQSLGTENKSLRSHNQALMKENEELRDELIKAQDELDASREELDVLGGQLETMKEEKATLREENASLVRHNDKYFNDNKVLRRENSGFEKSMHELHDENSKLKEEVEYLKDQVDHCRAITNENLSLRLDDEMTEENMTSAFFIPDITLKKNQKLQDEPTQTKEMPAPPELTVDTDFTEQARDITKEVTVPKVSRGSQQRSRSKSRGQSRVTSQSQKVSFSVPGSESKAKVGSNKANKGSKRTSSSQMTKPSSMKKQPTIDMTSELDDTTGLQSFDDLTEDQAMSFNLSGQLRQEFTEEMTSQSQKNRPQSRISVRQGRTAEITSESMNVLAKETCPALSQDARRVLDDLCEHNCKNCTVCARITAHRGIINQTDIASGRKRVVVSRPVPVTDRDLSVEDPTMRPARSPGHALALVIKGLEDESRHLQLELSRLQAKYNASDKALGRRDRISLAESIRTLLKTVEAKNDQIYNLYDVLEGQKAAGQAMTEDELEMTVFNITGMSVRDATGLTDLTWEGVPEQ